MAEQSSQVAKRDPNGTISNWRTEVVAHSTFIHRYLYHLGLGSRSTHVIKDYVASRQERCSKLAMQARDMQDMMHITHQQSTLLDTISGAKEDLAITFSFTGSQELTRPSAAAVREGMAQLKTSLTRMEERIDWLKMP
eukprot:CAMPEP_0173118592 /NCGR_PEP_ID=MMETSP1102-20130122/51156_1 /TAXON_ID=49646 /ORGANISM="Geminigera sp., Strain Caron Lab Isolate" /LENGTH=137 /DNA_ID=CAMNT_0014023785 /DNA_START=20 /DNA_END=430 /DNA_ORIENTATION=-